MLFQRERAQEWNVLAPVYILTNGADWVMWQAWNEDTQIFPPKSNVGQQTDFEFNSILLAASEADTAVEYRE